MEKNEIMRAQIFSIIENQMRDNDPPETKQTFKRLKKLGYNEYECKQLIGQCVAVEIFGTFKHGTPFNKERYLDNLLKLPEEPFD